MKYYYIILLCVFLSQCRVNKTSPKVLTLKDSICYIDTTYIDSKLKHIIKSYIHEHPQFDNLVLKHDNFAVKSKHRDIDIDELYVLGPTFSGESYKKWVYPAFFFAIDGKTVFINSYYDNFMDQELCENVYMNHLEIEMLSFVDEGLYWLIRIDRTGGVIVLTKNTEEYLGVDKVKEPKIFKAPVSKKAIK